MSVDEAVSHTCQTDRQGCQRVSPGSVRLHYRERE